MTDYSIEKCVEDAQKLIDQGADVYQKFTCDQCGNRLGMETPNVFYTTGTCDNCGHTTDISKRGCGYMVCFYKRGLR